MTTASVTIASTLGVAVALGILGSLVVGVVWMWRLPFRALGLLVAGMAVHNLVLMYLIKTETPTALVRAVQAWKEIIIAVLLVKIATAAVTRIRATSGTFRPRLAATDWFVVAFALLVCLYAVLQPMFGMGDPSLLQRFVSLRLALLMPMMYLCGRVFLPTAEDLRFVVGAILGSATVVGVFGLWELWFVPTRQWIDWGAVGFSRWLGFSYRGPEGLPANFFQTTESGLLLRRMVSTYLSPLGVAYTGLVLAPLSLATAAFARLVVPNWPRWLVWTVPTLVLVSIALSVTRLALLSLILECILLCLLLRTRTFAAVAAGAVALALAMLFVYPSVGPLMTSSLREAPSSTRFLRDDTPTSAEPASPKASVPPRPDFTPGGGGVLSDDDPSIQAHGEALIYGITYLMRHPLGTGPGSAVPRYGDTQGPSESALLRIAGEFGLFGGLLYAGMFLSVPMAAFVVLRGASGWERVIALGLVVAAIGLIPISVTSDVWGNFSVTYLFWWLAGLVGRYAALRQQGSISPARRVWQGA